MREREYDVIVCSLCSASEAACASAKPGGTITRFYKSRQAPEARQASDTRQARYLQLTAVKMSLGLSFLSRVRF